MARQNQFQLLRKRRFLPLFLTLISIYFNSNLFRNALLVIFAFHLAKAEANALINLATGLYLLPFSYFQLLRVNWRTGMIKANYLSSLNYWRYPLYSSAPLQFTSAIRP